MSSIIPNQVCFTCLETNMKELIRVYDLQFNIWELLTNIEPTIVQDPNDPKLVCRNCIREVRSSSTFVLNYRKANSVFNYLKQSASTNSYESKEVIVIENDLLEDKKDIKLLDDIKTSETSELPCYLCPIVLPDIESMRQHMIIHANIEKKAKKRSAPRKKSNLPRKNAIMTMTTRKRVPKREPQKSAAINCPCKDSNCDICQRKNVQQCLACRIIFKTFFELKKHRCQPKFQCNICLKTFLHRYNLKKHGIAHKKCAKCNKIFASNKLLVKHEKNHEVVFGFKCLKCSASFSTAEELKNHAEDHFYTCDGCKKQFNTISSRNRHVKNSCPIKKPQ